MSAVDILQFVNYLKAERGFSPHTLRAYLTDLAQFCDYATNGAVALEREDGAERPAPSLEVLQRAGRGEIRSFLAHVQTRHGSSRTAARKLAAIRAAYRFFIRQGRLDENPAQQVKSPKLPR